MQLLKSSLKIWIFIPLSMLNYLSIIYFFDASGYFLMSVFFSAILVNQYFLFSVVADMTGIATNRALIPTWMMAILKFLILIITLLLAVHNFENRIHIVVGIYIFQLIILVISTKRIVKKN